MDKGDIMAKLKKGDYLYWIREDGTIRDDAPDKFKKLYQEDLDEYSKGFFEYLKFRDEVRYKMNLYNLFMYEHYSGRKIF